MNDADGKIPPTLVLREFAFQNIFLTDQDDVNVLRAGCSDRPFDFGFRGVIAAHRIDSNSHHRVGSARTERLFFSDFDDFPALVLSAFGACAVR